MVEPELTVIIPVYNEEAILPALFSSLYTALDTLGRSYECLFIDDGSTDRSAALLREQFSKRPAHTRIILFNGNFGQHAAILAGFDYMQGLRAVTIDADLQNPPEEIAKLVRKMDEGYDYVGSIRIKRQDSWWRRIASRCINKLREGTTKIRMTDQGCMLRAYDRSIVQAIKRSQEINTFIPALAYLYARNPTEIEVAHRERQAGESKYSLYKLMRINFDLLTGFSLAPLQIFSTVGMVIAMLSGLLVAILLLRRLFVGPEVEGVFTLFGILFFLIGVVLFGIGMLGEYVGRIYQQVQNRPRYIVHATLENPAPGEAMRK
ncbi:MAG: glycosyltransferase [Nitrospirales bacterium]|nr:glycosyltransferase [Nitrospirales bacterium]